MKWIHYLSNDVYTRLTECTTIKADLIELVNAKWRWAQDTGHYIGYTKEDFLVDILDLLDCNGLYNITELTQEEWQMLTK